MLKIHHEVNQKFLDFYKEVFKEGNLSLKTKELIALAVSLSAGCAPCYSSHLEKAKKAGNTDDEIREAIAVAEVIGSGKIRAMAMEEEDSRRKT